jgi:Fe-Mn family superoxide dismutase
MSISDNNFSNFDVTAADLVTVIRESLGLKVASTETVVNESYVTQSKKFNLTTEFLSEKNKSAHLDLMEGYIESLNNVSAKLDAVDRSDASSNSSEFRSLKIDETYNLNAAFLHGLHFENISDMQSQLTMDSITFMRLERDFGTFDEWQKDFIACALSTRNGWVVTVYNTFLNRYINVIVDSHNKNIPFSSFPVVVLDCWEHAYYRDYLNDKKTYVHAMMKELNWDTIDARIKKAEKISKVTNS